MGNQIKKLMLIYLLVIPICKAAAPDERWYQAVQDIPNWRDTFWLNLIEKQITAIPDGFNPNNLQRLNLSNNKLTTIPANFNPPNLQILWLQNNQLTTFPANLQNLQFLYLDNNRIETIPIDLNLPHLRKLNLNSNWIEAIPAHLHSSNNLRELDLSDNNIEIIPDNIDFPRLSTLNLEENHIKHVNPEIFTQLPMLTELNLSKNPLTEQNVAELRAAAAQLAGPENMPAAFWLEGRDITIIADDIGPKWTKFTEVVKPAKRPKQID